MARPREQAGAAPEPQPFQSRLIPAPQFERDKAMDALRVRATERYAIEARAQVMSAADLERLNQWMKWAPTTDPLVALPMMLAEVAPGSDLGRTVTESDIAARIKDGTYANGVGIKGDGLGNSTRQADAPVPKPDDYQTEPEVSWWQTALDNITPDPDNEFFDRFMPDADTAAGQFIASGLEPLQVSSRSTLLAASSALEFVVSGFRSAAGDTAKVQALTERYGLSEEERSVAINIDALSPDEESFAKALETETLGTTSFKDMPADSKDRILRFLKDYRSAGTYKVGGAATGDARARMLAGESMGGQAFRQTGLGQASVEDITQDRGSWLPSPEILVKQEKAALEAYDIRTAEEVAMGIEPMAWTPGRGLANVWWDPDDTAFNVMSGLTDAAVSLGLDPVNAIPLGAAGKIVTAPARLIPGSKASLNAAMRGGRTVGVRTDVQVGGAIPEGRRGAANVQAAIGPDGTYQVDEVFRSRNVVVTDDGRVVSQSGGRVPHVQFLARDKALVWLNSGKGQRVIDDLTNEQSAYTIWKKSGGERGGITWELAEQLADARTTTATRAIVASRIGIEIDRAGQLAGFGKSPMFLSYTSRQLADNPIARTTSRLVDNTLTNKAGAAAARALAVNARGKAISYNDSDTLIRELDSFVMAAKIDLDEAGPAIDSVLRAQGAADRYAALYGPGGFFSKNVKDALVRQGLDEEDAARLVKAFDGGLDNSQREVWNKNIAFGGGEMTGSPTLMGEGLGDVILMPSYREILRAASKIDNIRRMAGRTKSGKFKTDAVGDALNEATSLWRSAVLVRPAYTLREVGEMSFSMALSGYSSFFTHPIQMIALATHIATVYASKTAVGNLLKAMAAGKGDETIRNGLRSEAARRHLEWASGEVIAGGVGGAWALAKRGVYEGAVVTGKTARIAGDVLDFLTFYRGMKALNPYLDVNQARITGDAMYEEFTRFMETGDPTALSSIGQALGLTHGNYVQDQVMRQYGKNLIEVRRPTEPGQPETFAYARGIADRLATGHADPDIRNIALGRPIDEAIDEYVQFRKAEKHTMFLNSRGMEEWATTKTDLDYFAAQEDVLFRLTGGDTELLEAVGTGMFNGKAIGPDNKDFVNKVKQVVEADPTPFPHAVSVLDPRGAGAGALDYVNNLASDFFQNTTAFSDVFSRAPLVRQAYAKRVIELAEVMSPAAKAQAVRNLREAGDVKLARQVQAVKARGGLGIDEVELIAAGYAKREAERVFYDASRRQNWALALRVVAPFAQATANTFKRWGSMSISNPQSYYRALKPLNALQQEGSSVLYDVIGGLTGDPTLEKFYEPGKPSLSADGFFYTDRYGERKFAYPLVGPMARLMGAPEGIVMESSMENLNVAGTTINPGLGPLITLPAAFALQDDISEKDAAGSVLRFMFPYGLPGDQDDFWAKMIGSVAPTAFRKLYDSSFDSNARMNTSIAVISALVDSGDYNLEDNAERTRLMNDAEALAERLMVAAALGGMATPSTFSPDVLVKVKSVEDKAGVTRWLMSDRIQEEWQKYTKDDYKTGALNFVRDFGGTALFAALPRTKTDNIAQATNDMWQFRTDNESAYRENIEVIGLFMSNDDLGSNFARELFMEQRGEKIRTYQTVDDYTEKVNDEIGWMLWNNATAEIDRQYGDDREVVANLRALTRNDLIRRYPGFSPSAKDTGKNMELIEKIRDALNNDAIRTLPSAYYADRYLRQRDAAINAMIEAGGTGNLNTKGAASIAKALFDLGTQYANEDTSGGFRHMWNRVLSQELYAPVMDEEETP